MPTLTTGEIRRQKAGTFTANGTTEVTLKVKVLEASSLVIVSLRTVGGTPAAHPYISTKNVSTKTLGFKAAAGDTSVYDVIVFA